MNHLNLRPWGRHSLILLIAGLLYVAIGVLYIVADLTMARENSLTIALQYAGIDFWGGVFVLVGAMAVVSARWPKAPSSWGYFALTALSSAWSAIYFLGVVFNESTSTNLSLAAVWALVAFLWWGISGLVEPDEVAILRGPA